MLREFDAKSFRENFVRRGFQDFHAELAVVRSILASVRQNGDKSVLEYTRQFDGVVIEGLRVCEDEYAAAEAAVEPAARDSLLRAAENIRAYHRRQLQNSWLEVLPAPLIHHRC
ncbi:MAG: Histidinol dehydrogenase [Firmicutes bacterium]|nr:Histidinol dehydrogenase [candidate division NPL-UPA2 bacterium]